MFSHIFMGAVIVAILGFLALTFVDCRTMPFGDHHTVCVVNSPR